MQKPADRDASATSQHKLTATTALHQTTLLLLRTCLQPSLTPAWRLKISGKARRSCARTPAPFPYHLARSALRERQSHELSQHNERHELQAKPDPRGQDKVETMNLDKNAHVSPMNLSLSYLTWQSANVQPPRHVVLRVVDMIQSIGECALLVARYRALPRKERLGNGSTKASKKNRS